MSLVGKELRLLREAMEQSIWHTLPDGTKAKRILVAESALERIDAALEAEKR